MQVLSDDGFFRIELDEQRATVALRRSARGFETLEQIASSHRRVVEVTGSVNRSELALLLDLRASTGRNDPVFEQELGRHRRAMMEGYRACAALLATTVGALQVQRYAKEDGVSLRTFVDEPDALSWLEAH